MKPFRGKATVKTQQQTQNEREHNALVNGIETRPGVIEWGNWQTTVTTLTETEKAALKGRAKRLSPKRAAKAVEVKQQMAHGKSYTQIAAYFRNRKGLSARTVWGIFKALSTADRGRKI